MNKVCKLCMMLILGMGNKVLKRCGLKPRSRPVDASNQTNVKDIYIFIHHNYGSTKGKKITAKG